jgi:hypothetical protein
MQTEARTHPDFLLIQPDPELATPFRRTGSRTGTTNRLPPAGRRSPDRDADRTPGRVMRC